MKKALTAGYVAEQAPATRTGVGAIQKEDLDYATKIVTWGQGDLKRLKIKTKSNKIKLIKSILNIKKQFPTTSITDLVGLFIERCNKKLNKTERIDKDLFKSIIKDLKKQYPTTPLDSIVEMALDIYRKKK